MFLCVTADNPIGDAKCSWLVFMELSTSLWEHYLALTYALCLFVGNFIGVGGLDIGEVLWSIPRCFEISGIDIFILCDQLGLPQDTDIVEYAFIWMQQMEAFAMGFHTRLGELSLVRHLPADSDGDSTVLRMIYDPPRSSILS